MQVDTRTFDMKLRTLTFSMLLFLFEPRYAYAVASALHGVQHILRKDFMLQVCLFFVKFFVLTINRRFSFWNWFLVNILNNIATCIYRSSSHKPGVFFFFFFFSPAPMGYGTWKKVYHSLHLWMWLQLKGTISSPICLVMTRCYSKYGCLLLNIFLCLLFLYCSF